jgi:hypothetical protein
MRRKLFLVTAFAAVALTAGAGIVFAAGAVSLYDRGGPSVKAVGGGTGSGCGTAFETREDPFFPGDITATGGDFDALTPASSVTGLKRCGGAAIATFSSETVADIVVPEGGPGTQDVDNDDIAIVVRATCLHPLGGNPNPCHAGDLVYGAPGAEDDPVLFDLAPDIYEVHSMQWAFSNLKPGTWRIDVLAGGVSAAPNVHLEWRTLFFETL